MQVGWAATCVSKSELVSPAQGTWGEPSGQHPQDPAPSMQLENTLKMALPLFPLVSTHISLLCTNHSPTSICFGLRKGHRKTIATWSHWTVNNCRVINMSFEEEFKETQNTESLKKQLFTTAAPSSVGRKSASHLKRREHHHLMLPMPTRIPTSSLFGYWNHHSQSTSQRRIRYPTPLSQPP